MTSIISEMHYFEDSACITCSLRSVFSSEDVHSPSNSSSPSSLSSSWGSPPPSDDCSTNATLLAIILLILWSSLWIRKATSTMVYLYPTLPVKLLQNSPPSSSSVFSVFSSSKVPSASFFLDLSWLSFSSKEPTTVSRHFGSPRIVDSWQTEDPAQ